MALVREEKFMRAVNLVEEVQECLTEKNFEAGGIVGGDMIC